MVLGNSFNALQRWRRRLSPFVPSFRRPRESCACFSAATTSRRLGRMSRNLPKGAPLPKAPFAAGVAIMGGMFYAVLLDAKGRQPDTLDTPAAEQGGANTLSVDADTSSSVPSSTVTAKTKSKTGARFLGGYEEVCAPTAQVHMHMQHAHHAHACALHAHGTHPARYRRPTYHRMCSLPPTWTTSKSCRRAEARRVCTSSVTPAALHPHLKSTCSVHLYSVDPPLVIYTTGAPHVHDTCMAGALYVHRMSTA